MKQFPTLFKKTNKGAIQQWTISVDDNCTIKTVHGQVDGKLQTTEDIIKEGKNTGKVNETTAQQQAELEAAAKYQKQKKKGYVEDINDAAEGKVDSDVIEGGIFPMLAPSKIWPHFAKYMTFPVFTQPKLDGARMIAVLKDGRCTLWSRTRKPIYSSPHIIEEIENNFSKFGDLILDGELYNVAYKDSFEDLLSLIRQEEPADNHTEIHYHIYDLPSCNGNFAERSKQLHKMFEDVSPEFLFCVKTLVAQTDEEIQKHHIQNVSEGYEGTMVRNDGPYEGGKRSYNLQKLKNWDETEFPIVGYDEGRGKDAGTIGSFRCQTSEGKVFSVRLKAKYTHRAELFKNHKLWKGFSMTIKHQGLTNDNIPRFPIGKGLRKGED